jgi:hypothetical protein
MAPDMPPSESLEPAAALARLWQQDIEIDTRVRHVLRALDSGDTSGARSGVADLEAFVHAHLEREEDVYFPAAEKLSPDNSYALRSIRLAHLGIREDLRQLRASLDKGHVDAARTQIRAFLESFRAHERAEDRVVQALSGAPRE